MHFLIFVKIETVSGIVVICVRSVFVHFSRMEAPILNVADTLKNETIEENDVIPYPGPTIWKQVRTICKLPVLLVMPQDRLFIKHWEVSMLVPIFEALVMVLSIVTFIVSLAKRKMCTFLIIVCLIFGVTFFALFVWSFFSTMFMDPGFLPFDWIKTRKTKYGYEEQLSGLAIRDDQFEYAERNKPPFASFSHGAGRFVIRGDHVCIWVSNWVGKRNHKQFLLMNFWGAFTCLLFAIVTLFSVNPKKSFSYFFFEVLAIGMEFAFGFSMLGMFIKSLFNLSKNKTTLQIMKDVESNDLGCLKNFQEVCGTGSFLSWIIPTPAFSDDLVL